MKDETECASMALHVIAIQTVRILSYCILCTLIITLSSCYYFRPPVDPSTIDQTSLTPANFWLPDRAYEPYPCGNCEYSEQTIEYLKKTNVVLADLIDVALTNNPTTEKTWALARAAAYGVDIARSALYPTVVLNESLTYTDTEIDDGPTPNPILNAINGGTTDSSVGFDGSGVGTNFIWTNNLSISYLLLDFGGRCANIEAAKQALYEADWTNNRQIQIVLYSVLQNYYTYSGLVALLESRHMDLKNSQTNLQAATELFHAGVKTKLDQLQAQTDVLNIELSIVDLEGQIQVAYGNLATSLGLPADIKIHVPEIPDQLKLGKICAGVEQLMEIAHYQRPDLWAVYAEHEQRRALVTVARSAGLPNITTNIDLQNNIFITNPSFNNRGYAATVSLNVPLFSGYLYQSQERQARELVREACADIRIKELEIALDIVRSYSDFKTAVESYHFSDEYLRYSQETFEAAQLSYREGVGTILDLLNAQRSLALARATKIQALTKWEIALANISFSTGLIGLGCCESMIKCKEEYTFEKASLKEGQEDIEKKEKEK